MGVKPFVIAPAMNAIIGQRLVRKLCQACKRETPLSKELEDRVAHLLKTIPEKSGLVVPKKLQFFHSPGCDECHKLGYKGRIGIFEVIEVNEEMEALILKDPTTTEIRKKAVEDGMTTMAQDGIMKALQGITDVEEVFRVAEG
jgi:type II secretory ATPase GspE/PulE/Tfp pilus assembly ATPase PilB-like protein